MIKHKYILEPLPELKFDKKRNRVKFCPCGKDNKDGKFVPYVVVYLAFLPKLYKNNFVCKILLHLLK